MIKNKEPSIFVDRGGIGSSDELDEYGVWVKSEPQDLSSSGADASELSSAELPADFQDGLPGTDDTDFEIPDMEDLPDFAPSNETEEDNDRDVFNFGDFTGQAELGSVALDPVDFDSTDFGSDESSDDSELSIDDLDTGLEIPEMPRETGEDDGDYREIAADDLIGLTDSEPDFTADPVDVSLGSVDAITSTDSFASADSFDLDDTLDESGEISLDMDSGGDEAAIPAANPASIAADPPYPVNNGPAAPSAAFSAGNVTSPPDLSTQLLMKIAEELSSIRNELTSLKKEFSGLKAAVPAGETVDSGYYGEEDDEKISLTGDELNNILNTADFTEEAGSDASIELSEDLDLEEAEDSLSFNSLSPQLDSVELDSAELDSVELDSVEIEGSDLDLEIDLGDSNLEELEGETKLGNSLSEESGDLDFDEQMPDLYDDDSGELREIMENGAEPMTPAPAPEDSDYLSEDTLEDNEFGTEDFSASASDDSLDLTEAVIDEPDLSSEIQDNPLEEPSLEDISISLDLSELDSIGSSESYSGETDLAETYPEETGSDQLPEGFVVEGTDYGSDELSSAESGLEDIQTLEDIQPLIGENEEELEILETDEGFGEIGEIGEIEEIPEVEDLPEEVEELQPVESTPVTAPKPAPAAAPVAKEITGIPTHLKQELKTVLTYMDQLLEALPDDKIEEFARSNYYETYKKLFKELGLV